MAASTVVYVFFTLKLVKATNHSTDVMNFQREILLEQKNDSFITSVLQEYSNKRDKNIATNGIKELLKRQLSTRKSIMNTSTDLNENVNQFYLVLKENAANLFNDREVLNRHIHSIWNVFYIIDRIDLNIEKKRYYLTIVFGNLSLEETALMMLSEMLNTANSPSSIYYTMNMPNVKGICELFRDCCPFLDESDAQNMLFDLLKNNNPRKEYFQW